MQSPIGILSPAWVVLCTLAAAVPGRAQTPRPMDQVPPSLGALNNARISWDHNRLITIDNYRSSRSQVTIAEAGTQGLTRTMEASKVLNGSLIHVDDDFWSLASASSKEIEGKREILFQKSKNASVWEAVGRFTVASKFPPDLAIPLRNGKVLTVHSNPAADGDEPSHFGLFTRREDGTYTLQSVYDMGLPHKPWAKIPGSKGPSEWRGNPLAYALTDTAYELPWGVTRVGDFAVVCHATTGLIWVFDLDTGQMKRLSKVFPEVDKRLSDLSSIECAVLLWQPTRTDTLLLCTRTEEAFLNARKANAEAMAKVGPQPKLNRDGDNPEAAWRTFQDQLKVHMDRTLAAQQSGFAAYPELLWWEYDPATGKFQRTSSPVGAPDLVVDARNAASMVLTQSKEGQFSIKLRPTAEATPLKASGSPLPKGEPRPPAADPKAH